MDKQNAKNEKAMVDMYNQEMKELQDSQKQIEEIAKVVCECCIENEEFTCSIVHQPCIFAKTFAETIHDKGYRKIPENAVVLTEEEKRKLLHGMYEQGKFDGVVKFAERVKMAFYYEFDELIPSIMADKIDEICKEITEEKTNASKKEF